MPRRKRMPPSAALGANLMLAPAVMAMRIPLMLAESRGAAHEAKETAQAVTEKATAALDGAVAAQFMMWGAASRFWFDAMSGRKPRLPDAGDALKLMEAALKPAGLAVAANHRRLSRKR